MMTTAAAAADDQKLTDLLNKLRQEIAVPLFRAAFALVGRQAPVGWTILPREVQIQILKLLDDPRDICSVAMCSRESRDVAADDDIWRPLYGDTFPGLTNLSTASISPHAPPGTWRRRFRERIEVDRDMHRQREAARRRMDPGRGDSLVVHPSWWRTTPPPPSTLPIPGRSAGGGMGAGPFFGARGITGGDYDRVPGIPTLPSLHQPYGIRPHAPRPPHNPGWPGFPGGGPHGPGTGWEPGIDGLAFPPGLPDTPLGAGGGPNGPAGLRGRPPPDPMRDLGLRFPDPQGRRGGGGGGGGFGGPFL